MKKYKAYKAKKLKFPRRLLFFIVVAAVIFGVTVFVGNKLKSRVDYMQKESGDTVAIPETEKASLETDINTIRHDSSLSEVMSGNFDPAGVTDEAKIQQKVYDIISGGFNSVSYTVYGEDGSLTYASPALQEMTRLPASEKLFSYELLGTLSACAEGSGLRMSAVMLFSDNIQADCAVAGELNALGFDEIIITGFEQMPPDNETVSKINTYLDALKKSAPVTYGVLLSSDTLSNSKNAPFIEKIFAKTDFLAIDMRNTDVDGAASLARNIQGSFSAYLLRPLLDGTDTESAKAVRKALTDEEIKACQYISSPIFADTTAADTEEDEDE